MLDKKQPGGPKGPCVLLNVTSHSRSKMEAPVGGRTFQELLGTFHIYFRTFHSDNGPWWNYQCCNRELIIWDTGSLGGKDRDQEDQEGTFSPSHTIIETLIDLVRICFGIVKKIPKLPKHFLYLYTYRLKYCNAMCSSLCQHLLPHCPLSWPLWPKISQVVVGETLLGNVTIVFFLLTLL